MTTLSRIAVPTFLRGLQQAGVLLDRLEAFAEDADGMERLLGARLAPDMHPFRQQVLLVADFAESVLARLIGVPFRGFDRSEATLPELRVRLSSARDAVTAVPVEAIDAAADRPVSYTFRDETRRFDTGLAYLLHAGIPNMQFHLAMAYAILRHAGCPMTKNDYFGNA